MDFTIVFCSDGILRAQWSLKEPMIPLSFIQEDSKFDDFSFWCNWWDKTVFFEDGLTISSFLKCLEPWADFWSKITHKDILSYIQESKKPILIENDDECLSWISLRYCTEVSPCVEFQKEEIDPENIDINVFFNKKRNYRLNGQWNMRGSYKLTGYKMGVVEHYGIEHTPINKIANTPLVLDSSQTLHFEEFWGKKALKDNFHFFKNNAFGLKEVGEDFRGHFKYIQGSKYHKIKDVIEAFFLWFPKNPTSRESFIEEIEKRIADSENDDSKKEIKSNVVSLFAKEENKKEIKISHDAFSSIQESYDRSQHYWSHCLNHIKNTDHVVKIGGFKSAKPLENRFLSFIVSDQIDGSDFVSDND